MKKCGICQDTKIDEEFNPSKSNADGLYSWCKVCRKEYDQWYRENNIKKTIISGARGNAKAKNIEFDITEDDFEVPEVCPVLGIPIKPFSDNRDFSPSIDRIDNGKGYVKGNVCIISARANRLKSDSSLEEMKMILEWRESFE